MSPESGVLARHRKTHHDPRDPHPLSIFAGSNSSQFAAKIAQHLGCALGRASTAAFPNGESMVRIFENVRSRDVFIVQSICRNRLPTDDNPSSGCNDAFMELLLWIDALARASANRITAVIPFFGYARQDRKAEGRTPISAKVICDCLAELGCDRVLTMDLHSDQIQGFFRGKDTKLDHLNAVQVFSSHFRSLSLDNAVVLSPDYGNLKKADRYRQGLPSFELAFIDKRRDPVTGEVTAARLVGNVAGKSVILLDDIISTAGTMQQAIEFAVNAGARDFYIAATHGEFVGNATERLNHPMVRQICVTDTVPMLDYVVEGLPVKVLSVAHLFAEAISRVHSGDSISELLEQ